MRKLGLLILMATTSARAASVTFTTDQTKFLPPSTGSVPQTLTQLLQSTISVKSFGAVADNTTDNSPKIQAAINAAALVCGTVLIPAAINLYKITSTLTVPACVRLLGQGRAATALSTPTKGSVLSYSGTGTAVKVQGHLASIEHLTVMGTVTATGSGIAIDGNVNQVESVILRDVLIYGFTGGNGLFLDGEAAGAVAYGLFQDVRIRNAKIGIHIFDVGGAGGFVNTNQFIGGAISGTGFDYGIFVEGGNDNRFFGMSVEPPSSTFGNIVISRGAINFDGRIEGSTQPVTTPLVDVQAGATGGFIDGLGGSGLVKNAAPYFTQVRIVSGKHAEPRPAVRNLFRNSVLNDADLVNRLIPEWTVVETGGASTWTRTAAELADGAPVLNITVPAAGNVELKPASQPTRYDTTSPASFGIWVKTSTPSAAFARINGVGGVTTGAFHSGSGLWEPVSMSQNISSGAQPDARFEFSNSTGAPVTFSISAPYFAFGFVNPETVGAVPVTGGVMSGAIEGGGGTATIPAAGDNEFYTTTGTILTTPKWNTVHVAGTARTVARFNSATNKYSKYSTVRLVFDIAAVGVTNGGFLTLASAYTSAAGSWLVLESNGDGTWVERARGPVQTGTITLVAGTGTAAIRSGASCTCTDATANVSVKCSVATTTLTATGTATDVIAYNCN